MSVETKQASAPTPEQAKVIGTKARRVLVNAFAGTGKTTTATKFAKHGPLSGFYTWPITPPSRRKPRPPRMGRMPDNAFAGLWSDRATVV